MSGSTRRGLAFRGVDRGAGVRATVLVEFGDERGAELVQGVPAADRHKSGLPNVRPGCLGSFFSFVYRLRRFNDSYP